MASVVPSRGTPGLSLLLRGSPLAWAAAFMAASPWLRFQWGEFTVYPGYLLLSAALGVVLMRSGPGERGGGMPLKPGLALGAYLTGLAAFEGRWMLAGVVALTVVLHGVWGWGAYRLGRHRGGAGALPDALILLLGGSLLMGLVTWAVAAFWPAGCLVLNCGRPGSFPLAFRGGWNDQEQYLLFLLLVMPLVATTLLQVNRNPRAGAEKTVLTALVAGSALALLAGATAGVLVLAALALAGLVQRLRPFRVPQDQRLLRYGLAILAIGAVLVYGLFPAYLGLGTATPGTLRVVMEGAPPEALSSERETPLRVRVVNAGRITLFGQSAPPVRLRVRVLITPERGTTRTYDGEGANLTGPLHPGDALPLTVAVRLPPWVKEGFLAWRVEGGEAAGIGLAADSDFGFRFTNPDFRPLTGEEDNLLSALAQRARDFQQKTFPPPLRGGNPHGWEKIVGDILDTLFFSPAWGALGPPPGEVTPFSSPRPFWGQLLQGYGLIGVALALWFALDLTRRAARIARHSLRTFEKVFWRLLPLSAWLLALSGIISPQLGSFHAAWGLFLLAVFVSGRHDRLLANFPAMWRAKSARRWALPRARRRGFPRSRVRSTYR